MKFYMEFASDIIVEGGIMDPSVDEAALALGCWFWGGVDSSMWDSLYSLL